MNPFQLLRAEQSQRKRLKQPWELERPAKVRTLPSVVDQSSFRLGRAGLAFDMNNIIAWETHEKWTSFLMQSLTREVPPGYATISINQLLRADSELFLLMSKEISSVKADSSGRLQADEAMNRLKTDPRITMYLLPLPKSAPSATPPGSQRVEPAPAPSSSKRTKTRTPPSKVKGLMAPVKTDGLASSASEAQKPAHHGLYRRRAQVLAWIEPSAK